MEKIGSKYNIVIVDDEPIVTSTLKTLLKLEGNYEPVIFNSPIEALEYIKKSEIDLVISDFLMPVMNGIEFLSEVKKIYSGATLILLTGYADKESAIRAINDIDLYRYIEKPWDNEDLILCIKNGLERSHLLEKLEQKVSELSQAKKQLQDYNEQLEHIVQERTADLIKSNVELEKTNTKLSAIINHSADGIITVSKEGIICQINPAFEKICGLNSGNIIRKDFLEIFTNDNYEHISEKLNPQNDILLRDYKIVNRKTGKIVPVEASFAPVISSQQLDVNYYVGVIRDITLQYEMERLREDFIATLTHDLRTPLLAAIQTLQFFLDGSLGELSERQHKLLETMFYSNQDMLGLVNALLEVYKYESGQLVLCKDLFELNDFITQCVQEVQPLVENKNIDLKIDYVQEKIFADKQELKRVIANLLGNAINYTQSGGKIRIYTDFNDESVTITVEDTGTGIPAEDIPKLFNRFSQGTSKKRSCGTGLGLYLSKQIIEAHDGKIWLESELGAGSKFKFTIPKANDLVFKE